MSAVVDIAIVGAGAAGLATAIFAARRMPGRTIVALDGAKKLGAKILVAGGGRCNVTNERVTSGDFCGGSRNTIKQILAALPVSRTVEFFREIGVMMHVEEHGKLFPDSNSAKTVLAALIAETERRGIQLLPDCRVYDVACGDERFTLKTSQGNLTARAVVLATGGRSLPKTGSDGGGYALAQALGHSLVPTTPGLAPLILDGDFHPPLSGIAQDVELTLAIEGVKPFRVRGAMLWTHFGVSGPAALDASRHWHRATLEDRKVTMSANLLPGCDFAAAEKRLINLAAVQPRTLLSKGLATLIPARVAEAIVARLRIEPRIVMAHLGKDVRRAIVHALIECPLPVRDSRGYNFAEVTAGGVPLSEIDPSSMASRECPGLFLVGEILDVDGRIGGFNFQWAWSSGCAAAAGLENRLGRRIG
ncbi:MAG: NAD(P)/FAD-dependent oxidoreductase [Phycisphaerales bacterium]|nr:NAD(P)/FAD-dependent oxidoreductase [Phycisphaerales bacterium]